MLLPTEKCTFIVKVFKEYNDLNEPVFEKVVEEIDNCLVSPVDASTLPPGFDFLNKILINVHLPKTYVRDLVKGSVVVRGREFKILTVEFPLTRSPLPWNRYATCERIGGYGD